MLRTLSAILLLASLAGCGGSDGGPVANSPFAGHWAGTFTTNASQNGTADWTIANDGGVTGTNHNSTGNFDFAVSGTIQNDGHLTGNFSGGTVGTLDGNVTATNSGHLTGTIHQMHGSATVTLDVDLVPVWP